MIDKENSAPASLATAAAHGEPLFSQVLEASRKLKRLAEVPRAPPSWADAQAAVAARDEEKKKREQLRKEASKSKGLTAEASLVQQNHAAPQPGAVIGSVADASAFWMFVEDYFRDVAYEDVQLLVPHVLDISQDADIYVPPVGREEKQEIAKNDINKPSGQRKAAAKSQQFMQDYATMMDDNTERRSSRLGSKRGDMVDDPLGGKAPDSVDALALGFNTNSQRTATMLQACTDEEVFAMGTLLSKLGLVSEQNVDPKQVESHLAQSAQQAGQFMQTYLPLPALATKPAYMQDRASVEMLMHSVAGLLGVACSPAHQSTETLDQKELPQANGNLTKRTHRSTFSKYAHPHADTPSSPTLPPVALPPPANNTAAVDGQHTTTPQFTGQVTEIADSIHPFTQLLLARPPTLYVTEPSSQTGYTEEPEQEMDPQQQQQQQQGTNMAAPATTTMPAPPAKTSKASGNNKKGKSGRKGATWSAPSKKNPNKAAAASTAMDTMQQEPTAASKSIPDTTQMPDQITEPSTSDLLTTTSLGANAITAAAIDDQDTEMTQADGNHNGVALSPRPSSADQQSVTIKQEYEGGPEPRVSDPGAAQGGPGGIRKRGGARVKGQSQAAGAAGAVSKAAAPGVANRPAQSTRSETPLAAAVAAYCATGEPEGSTDDQWSQLDTYTELLGCAPDDEILAEILTLQSELVQQVAINRQRVTSLLQRVMDDLPQQETRGEERKALQVDIKHYIQRKADWKKAQKREQMAARKAASMAGLDMSAALAGRGRRGKREDGEDGDYDASREATPDLAALLEAATGPLEDPFSVRMGEEEEALCGVCGDGASQEGNEIVFCERCDLAVHQDCYGLAHIPEGEWLCWPCHEYEKEQLAQGKPQSEVRPPRWELSAKGISAGQLGGGSLDVSCKLCPVKRGAFKRTEDGLDWVHIVCALWHAETDIIPGTACDCVVGVTSVKPERWQTPCMVCQQKHAGATVKCAFGTCSNSFHPLCGRRLGNYMCTKANASMNKLQYRAYCHVHTPSMIAKDTPLDGTKPLQAAVDIRRSEVRKDMSLAKPKREKERPSAMKANGYASTPDGFDDDGQFVSPHEHQSATAYKAGLMKHFKGKGAAHGGAAATASGEPRTKRARLPSSSHAAATTQVATPAFEATPYVPPPPTPLELEYSQINDIRYEWDKLRHVLAQVHRREKLSRVLCRQISELETARAQAPDQAADAILNLDGNAALNNLPEAATDALAAAEAWWAENKHRLCDPAHQHMPIPLALQSPIAMPSAFAMPDGLQVSSFSLDNLDGNLQGFGFDGMPTPPGLKRKRDSIATAPSREKALEAFQRNHQEASMAPPLLAPLTSPVTKPRNKKKQKAGPAPSSMATLPLPAAETAAQPPQPAQLQPDGNMQFSNTYSYLGQQGIVLPPEIQNFDISAFQNAVLPPPPPAYEPKQTKRRKKDTATGQAGQPGQGLAGYPSNMSMPGQPQQFQSLDESFAMLNQQLGYTDMSAMPTMAGLQTDMLSQQPHVPAPIPPPALASSKGRGRGKKVKPPAPGAPHAHTEKTKFTLPKQSSKKSAATAGGGDAAAATAATVGSDVTGHIPLPVASGWPGAIAAAPPPTPAPAPGPTITPLQPTSTSRPQRHRQPSVRAIEAAADAAKPSEVRGLAVGSGTTPHHITVHTPQGHTQQQSSHVGPGAGFALSQQTPTGQEDNLAELLENDDSAMLSPGGVYNGQAGPLAAQITYVQQPSQHNALAPAPPPPTTKAAGRTKKAKHH